MSHNKNYSKFSQKKENVNLEEIFPETEVIEADNDQELIIDPGIEAEVEQAQENVEEMPQNIEETVQPTVGFVDGCKCLRVREESNVDSKELCIINKLSEVVIDLDNSTDYFYKVKTSEGVEGYCMKKFITIK